MAEVLPFNNKIVLSAKVRVNIENKEIENLEFANNVFNHMHELFFDPEIIKRKAQNIIPQDFTLVATQAILFPDGRPDRTHQGAVR
jgi:hypothetical protein